MTYLIVGLGNPGRDYSQTRHNVGFLVVERLAHRARVDLGRRRSQALYGAGALDDHQIILAQPQTYMNESGQSVRGLLDWFKLDRNRVIVVYDERDLPVGRVRFRPGGSAAGHRGVQSVIRHLGTDQFARVRIGIGRPPGDAADHVLSRFTRDEIPIIDEAIDRAVVGIRSILDEGIDAAMNRFNAL
ncbi:MAG TPA: aminoacyl-tRNA hydrolase [Chloroflexota bacterium]|nr:aminoacyl-tRNA hydrolase [Chloroflexota bacterium]